MGVGVRVRHLPLLVFVLIWMQMQRSFPLLFSLSPVIASTLVLLGTLLFYGHGSNNNNNNNNNNKGWETGSDFAGSSSPSASSLADINSMLDDLRPLSDSELPFPQVSTDHSRQSADLLDDDDDDDDDEGDTTIMENLIARQKALKLMRMQAEQRMLNNNNLSPQTNNYYHIHQSNMIPRRRRHSFDPLPAFQSVRKRHSFHLLQSFDFSTIGPYSIPEQRILHNPQTNNYLSPPYHHIHESKSNPSVVRLRHSFNPPLPSLQSDSSVRRRHSFHLLPRTCHQTTLGQLASGLPHTWDIQDNEQGGDDRIKEVKLSGYEEKTSSKSSSSSFFDVSDNNEEEEYRSVDNPISEELQQIEDSGVDHSATRLSQVHHRVNSWLTGWKA